MKRLGRTDNGKGCFCLGKCTDAVCIKVDDGPIVSVKRRSRTIYGRMGGEGIALSVFNFSKANCQNCYKCLRTCPVKAIKIKDEQAEIVEERCIDCGQCLIVCPQHAREIKSDLAEIKEAIANRKRVIASVAPSFAGAFEMDHAGQFVAALKTLGFYIVEETAVGAEVVAKFYKRYMEEQRMDNIITTSCPATNYLFEIFSSLSSI